MRNALAWFTLGVVGVSLATASCGDDEATGGDDDGDAGGGVIESGGSSGKGGSAGSGGKAGSSGSGGSSGTGAGKLGQACVTDNECGTTGLTCLENDEMAGSGPPKGLCTTPCSDDTVCSDLAPGAFCIEFPDGEGYCIESCSLGTLGEPKCNEREEFGCGIVGVLPGTGACVDSDDCTTGQLCIEGVCNDSITACIPVCGGDYNCGEGQFCDYLSGFCVPDEPTGLPIGAPCNPAAETDPCHGFCVQVSDTEGMCSADCTNNRSGSGCGFNGMSPADAVCLWLPAYADSMDVGVGDTLFCGPVCDCNDECAIEGWGCYPADPLLGGGAADFFMRAGVCMPIRDPQTIDDTLGACPDTGSGGAGAGGASAGSGGETGETGGAGGEPPTGEAGGGGVPGVSGAGGQSGAGVSAGQGGG
jgi:hypothetical protein